MKLGPRPFLIAEGGLSRSAVRDLVRLHLEGMHAASPPGAVFALDADALESPGVRFFVAWAGEAAVGLGALKGLDPEVGEIKSMRTHPHWLRRGVAAAMLAHLIREARADGLRRLCLETGSGAAFAPALALYRRFGFESGEAFGDYVKTDFNQFLRLDLDRAPDGGSLS